jgi:hypothetical protein
VQVNTPLSGWYKDNVLCSLRLQYNADLIELHCQILVLKDKKCLGMPGIRLGGIESEKLLQDITSITSILKTSIQRMQELERAVLYVPRVIWHGEKHSATAELSS